uniref:Uncharacterized protein n=1 Tax=Anguilla anguilla TaxID=7936 RepID=A0A0E9P6B4_ANGAN
MTMFMVGLCSARFAYLTCLIFIRYGIFIYTCVIPRTHYTFVQCVQPLARCIIC